MDELLNTLNTEQRQAVTHGDGPMLIVAGAGTGKTTVITRRIAHLIEQGLAKPDEILALTFTDKAAGEMEERVDRLMPYGYVELWISTFHAFCERVLRHHAIEVGLPNDFKLLNVTDAWLLVRQNLNKFNLDYYRPLGNPTKFIHALLKHFSRAKDECVDPEEYLSYAQNLKLNTDSSGDLRQAQVIFPERIRQSAEESKDNIDVKRLEEIANAYHVYQNLLLEKNAFDFGDLINYTLKLFRSRPRILEEYRQKFKYILVDEFQDNNIAQYELVKLLAAPKNNLTVVGDDDQAIYRFRGASISNILAFKKDYSESRKIFLIQNYRSRQNLLDFSYKFIQLNNPNRLEYQLASSPNPHLNPPNLKVSNPPLPPLKLRGGEVGLLSSIRGGEEGEHLFSKRLTAQDKISGIIEHLHTQTHFAEARAVIDKMVEIKENRYEIAAIRKSSDLAMTEAVNWNDFAILVRANDHADLFIRELADRGIPYQFFASRGLYSKPIILDILGFLRLLDNYHESAAMYRVLNFPVWKISEAARIELLHHASRKSISLYSTLKLGATLGLAAHDVTGLQKIISLIEKYTVLARTAKVGQVMLAFLEDSGYLKWLTEKEDRYRLDSINYLNIFWKKVQEFELEAPEPRVKHFLSVIDMEVEAGEEGALPASPDEGPETVKIMTVHAAKGLEFRYVFIVNLVDQRFPTRERKEAIELPDALVKETIPEGDVHLQEERRLFYVACTRAKEGLFLCSANDYGGARARKPSRFLFETGVINNKLGTRYQVSGNGNTLIPASRYKIGTEEQKIETLTESKYELPSKLSFTQIKAFETCPLQYKYTHLLKIPVRGRGTFSFGKTIHNTLYKFLSIYKDKKNSEQSSLFSLGEEARIKNYESRIMDLLSVDELFKIYEESFIDDWFRDEAQKQEYAQKGKKVLKSFYESIAETSPDIFGLEIPFTFKIAARPFKGAIDRVDRLPDGTLEIIDYKTGQSKDLETVDREQLLIYQLAAKELFHESISKLTFWYVEDGKKNSFLGNQGDLEKLRARISVTIDEMQKSAFPATPGEFKCKFCDFRDICEFRII